MNIEEIIQFVTNKKFIISVVIAAVTIILAKLLKHIFKKQIKRNKSREDKKKNTYLNLLSDITKYSIYIIGVMVILQINGINVSSILAGLGIASVITGLALQDALKDIIMGFNIIVDSYFSIGDVIKFDDVEGKVISMRLKSTRIKDIGNDNIYTIANRNIDRALVISNIIDIDIPLQYEAKKQDIEAVLEKVIEKAKENEKIKDIKYVGIKKFGDSAIEYKLRITTNPEMRGICRIYVNGIIKEIFEQENITIPYTQIDIHTK